MVFPYETSRCSDTIRSIAEGDHLGAVQSMNSYADGWTASLESLGKALSIDSQWFDQMNAADTYLKRCWGEGIVSNLDKPSQKVYDALATQNLTPEKVPEFPSWAIYGVKHAEAAINEITKYLGHGTSEAASYLSSSLGKIFSLVPAEAAGAFGVAMTLAYVTPRIAKRICGSQKTYDQLFGREQS